MNKFKKSFCSHNCSHDIYYIKFNVINKISTMMNFSPVYRKCHNCGFISKNLTCSYEIKKENWVKHISNNLDLSFLDFYPFIKGGGKKRMPISELGFAVLGEVDWYSYLRELKLKQIIECEL